MGHVDRTLARRKTRHSPLARDKLERLDALRHVVKGTIKFLTLRDPASQDRLEIGEIGDVNDVIDTVSECARGIIGGKGMAEEHDEMLAPLCVRFLDQFA